MDPLGAPTRLHGSVIWLLGQTSNQGHRLIGERMHATGVPSRSYYPLLAALAESGATSQADLGRRIGLDRSDVTAAVTDLEGRGYLDRAPDPADRRRNLVRITEEGERFLGTLDGHLDSAQDELLDPLSPQERESLQGMLARLVLHHTGLRISGTEER
ncbi:transcriptional regulator, MarR family [Catenulispora acidiphila DSM 44928]|uniref:Transcriptional regulator, MarR family n=1 Tax=Catenulispora acidiphila (strain DSM 44928 / JCM 14897 / NBRC 102108 / NRRL B-24433 / ID139908) TaxID=479433 RepID=C7QCH5_CATAD|nr:MarR family transcriptional regulator [Catenulispora acidiphila]ACU76438.1 transcriptional regulator, MarR family [Catenulispora acidiphila DSM 44928]